MELISSPIKEQEMFTVKELSNENEDSAILSGRHKQSVMSSGGTKSNLASSPHSFFKKNNRTIIQSSEMSPITRQLILPSKNPNITKKSTSTVSIDKRNSDFFPQNFLKRSSNIKEAKLLKNLNKKNNKSEKKLIKKISEFEEGNSYQRENSFTNVSNTNEDQNMLADRQESIKSLKIQTNIPEVLTGLSLSKTKKYLSPLITKKDANIPRNKSKSYRSNSKTKKNQLYGNESKDEKEKFAVLRQSLNETLIKRIDIKNMKKEFSVARALKKLESSKFMGRQIVTKKMGQVHYSSTMKKVRSFLRRNTAGVQYQKRVKGIQSRTISPKSKKRRNTTKKRTKKVMQGMSPLLFKSYRSSDKSNSKKIFKKKRNTMIYHSNKQIKTSYLLNRSSFRKKVINKNKKTKKRGQKKEVQERNLFDFGGKKRSSFIKQTPVLKKKIENFLADGAEAN